MEKDCNPDYLLCRCCVCQGKYCLVWHPGHSHMWNETLAMEKLMDKLNGLEGESVNGKPEVSKTSTEGSTPSSPANLTK